MKIAGTKNRLLSGFLDSDRRKIQYKMEGSGRVYTGGTGYNFVEFLKMLNEGRSSTISDIYGRLGFSYRIFQRILRYGVNKQQISEKFVPRLLTDDQKCWTYCPNSKATTFKGKTKTNNKCKLISHYRVSMGTYRQAFIISVRSLETVKTVYTP
jgi:hypothetical protein